MVKKIHILKDSRGLGVQISMKLNHVTGEKGVFVSDISPGGAAARFVFLVMLAGYCQSWFLKFAMYYAHPFVSDETNKSMFFRHKYKLLYYIIIETQINTWIYIKTLGNEYSKYYKQIRICFLKPHLCSLVEPLNN